METEQNPPPFICNHNSLHNDCEAASSSRVGLKNAGQALAEFISVDTLWLPQRRYSSSSIGRGPSSVDRISPAIATQGDDDMLPQSETHNTFEAGISIFISLTLEIMHSILGPRGFLCFSWLACCRSESQSPEAPQQPAACNQ